MSKQRGFTLIELVIVVAIVAILSAIAYPSYQQYIKRGTRSAAQQYMMDVAMQQEQYAADNPGAGYTTSLSKLQLATIPSRVDDNYTAAVTQPGGVATWTVTLTPKAGSSMAGESTLTLNHQGVKTPADEW